MINFLIMSMLKAAANIHIENLFLFLCHESNGKLLAAVQDQCVEIR